MSQEEQPKNEFKTYLHISGVLGKDPQLVYSSKGTAICNFTLCHNTGARGAPNNRSIWFNCTAFGDLAEWIAENYSKGQVIRIIEASPDQDNWTYQGKPMKKDKWKIWKVEGYDTGEAGEEVPETPPLPGDDDVPY